MKRVPLLRKPILSVLLSLIIFLFIFGTSSELIARSAWFEKISPYRSVGNYHYQFEIKWFRLQDFVEQNGGVDIIILGSSLANTGMDPDVIASAFTEQTGVKPRIFNFGVEGLTIAPNSIVARILVERYHPALLIYVTEMREFVAGSGLDYETRFLADPWLQYEGGNMNFRGWMVDHSATLQHYLPFRNWMRADFLETLPLYLKRTHDTTPSGYELDRLIGKNIDATPDVHNPEDAKDFAAYGQYQIDPSRLENLATILDLSHNVQTKILVVEMPVHPTFYDFVGGARVHQKFQQTIKAFVELNAGSFLPAETCNDIPLEGRSNRWHLNYIGAPIFSKCLGQQLSILAKQQNTDFIHMNTGGVK
jgi:hypothetical protein